MAGLLDRVAAIPGLDRRLVHQHALADGERDRRLGLFGVDARAFDRADDITRELPPLREEHAAAGLLEVVVDGDRQRRDVTAVAVEGDHVADAVVMQRLHDLLEDLEEGRRGQAHRARELHVVPGQRHVEGRGDQHAEAIGLGLRSHALGQAAGDDAVGVERHVRAVLLGRADREDDGVDAGLKPCLDFLPCHPLHEVLGHHATSAIARHGEPVPPTHLSGKP